MEHGGTWERATIVSGFVWGSSIALDASGLPVVAFSDASARLRLARRDGAGAWTIEAPLGDESALAPSLAIDAQSAVHVAYLRENDLFHATDAGGTWRTVRVEARAFADTAIALDAGGHVHLASFGASCALYATNR